jgi:sulfonate transport system substrate-binding protein
MGTKGIFGAFLLLVGSLVAAPAARADSATPVRIGYQPTTTVEAQVAHTLRHTDILQRNGLDGTFTLFSYGPAVNEALVSGAIDVAFIGDMPSVSLAAINAPATVVGRQSVFRGAIVASTASNIKTMADLKGKDLYGPFGSSIYLAALSMLDRAGLKAGKDVKLLNMGFADLSDALRSGKIEALFVWDPWIQYFVDKGMVRVLSSDSSLTMVIAMRDQFMKDHPEAVEKMLKAHKEATLFAATHQSLANQWFVEPEAAHALKLDVVQTATAYDPQWNAKSLQDIRVSMSAAEMKRYMGLAEQAYELKIYPARPPLDRKTNMSYAEKVDRESWSFDPSNVKVRK